MLVKAPRKLDFNGSRRWNWITATALLGFSLSLGLVTLGAADKKQLPDETAKAIDPQIFQDSRTDSVFTSSTP